MCLFSFHALWLSLHIRALHVSCARLSFVRAWTITLFRLRSFPDGFEPPAASSCLEIPRRIVPEPSIMLSRRLRYLSSMVICLKMLTRYATHRHCPRCFTEALLLMSTLYPRFRLIRWMNANGCLPPHTIVVSSACSTSFMRVRMCLITL